MNFVGRQISVQMALFLYRKPWRNTLWSNEGVRKVLFFSELWRHFNRQRVVRRLKAHATLQERTMQ